MAKLDVVHGSHQSAINNINKAATSVNDLADTVLRCLGQLDELMGAECSRYPRLGKGAAGLRQTAVATGRQTRSWKVRKVRVTGELRDRGGE